MLPQARQALAATLFQLFCFQNKFHSLRVVIAAGKGGIHRFTGYDLNIVADKDTVNRKDTRRNLIDNQVKMCYIAIDELL